MKQDWGKDEVYSGNKADACSNTSISCLTPMPISTFLPLFGSNVRTKTLAEVIRLSGLCVIGRLRHSVWSDSEAI